MLHLLRAPALAAALLCLSGCGNSEPATGAGAGVGPRVPVTEDRAGTIIQHVLASKLDGGDIPITLFEPTEMKKGGRYPVVLYGHGWGGSRVTAPDFYTSNLNDRGMYVISFDQRGFGQSGGTVRAMDPDYDAQDLIQLLDWAEALPGLQRFADGRMAVGAIGGSYGGLYQYSLIGADPQRRLRVIAPDVTPYDLDEALYPGGVIKTGWGLQLLAGLALAKPDPIISQLFAAGIYGTRLGESYRNFLHYHSLRYFCEGQPPRPQSFVIGTADTFLVPPGPLPKIDAFISQGFRDTLFHFNQAVDAYDCLRQLGGDVRLHTHQSGHVFSQASITNLPGGEQAIDPLYSVVTLPNSGDVTGNHQCGSVNSGDATFAWFQEKLQGKTGAVDAVLKAGRNICLSLEQGDAVAVREVKRGGTVYAIDDSLPQFNAVIGTLAALAGEAVRQQLLATQILDTVPAGGAILAGIPTMDLTLTDLSGATPACAGVDLACDPILFIGIGRRRAGEQRFDLIDDQVTPLRGFGGHAGRMVGVAERLQAGDQLALLVYGYHAQYPLAPSRDLATPAVRLGGQIALPLLSTSEIAQDGGL